MRLLSVLVDTINVPNCDDNVGDEEAYIENDDDVRESVVHLILSLQKHLLHWSALCDAAVTTATTTTTTKSDNLLINAKRLIERCNNNKTSGEECLLNYAITTIER